MKHILILVTFFLCVKASAQNTPPQFDGKNWQAPYSLDVPTGWDVERFLIPIGFAPVIPYKGVEDIRFTPGWANKETTEYWSYTFLWYLDGKQAFDSRILEKYLVAYYTGLFNINTDKSKLDTSGLKPVTAAVEAITTGKGDLKTFRGTVNMNDYMTKKPITLHFQIHVKTCEGQDKTFVFYEASPMAYTDPVWSSLDQLWNNFRYTVN